ncbi:MAG: Zn-ribbon domain-containing OB-fold protein [Acidimicrobiia bacterium]
MAIGRDDFPLPDVDDPLTAPYFAGAARGELMITRCAPCGIYVWYPTEQCPTCAGPLAWTAVSGAGSLFSWATVRRAFLPAFADRVPFVTALVAIVEDPSVRLATYLVDADADTLGADEPVQVTFRPLSFSTVPGKSVIVPMFQRLIP